jgi:hypothetical protein
MQELKKADRNLLLIQAYYCIRAAHNLYMAHLNSQSAMENNNSIRSAQITADLCNLFGIGEQEANASEFMIPDNEYAEKAMRYHSIYKSYIDSYPHKERLIKAFAQWYMNCGEAYIFHYQAIFMINIGDLYLGRHMGKYIDYEVERTILNWKSDPNPLMRFNEYKIKRMFVLAMWKIKEFEAKIIERTVV